MYLVGSRFRLGRHHAGDSHAELCIIVLGGDFGFGDGFECRVDDDDAQDWVLVVSAVELKRCAAEVLPIDRDLD